MSKRDELVNKLVKAYNALKNNRNGYEVFEQLEPSRGEDNYKITFIAKKKKGFGFLKAVVDTVQSAVYGGVEGLFWRVTRTAAERIEGPMLEPIKRDFKGYEIAMIFKRWSETIPEGFIETIGNTLSLPTDDSWIAYEINPGKEIRVIIDFVKLKGTEVESEAVEKVAPEPKEIGEIKPEPVPVAHVPPAIPIPYPGMIDEMARRAYLAGSLRNLENGFAFDLINPFGDINIIAPLTLVINGSKIPPRNIVLKKGGKSFYSVNISSGSPISFRKGEQITVEVNAAKLQPGEYNLKINTVMDGMGSLSIQVKDNI